MHNSLVVDCLPLSLKPAPKVLAPFTGPQLQKNVSSNGKIQGILIIEPWVRDEKSAALLIEGTAKETKDQIVKLEDQIVYLKRKLYGALRNIAYAVWCDHVIYWVIEVDFGKVLVVIYHQSRVLYILCELLPSDECQTHARIVK